MNPAAADSPYDFNRDGLVNAADQILARSRATPIGGGLKLISVPAAPVGMAVLKGGSVDSALAAAVAIAVEVDRFSPETNLVKSPKLQRESEEGAPELKSPRYELDGHYDDMVDPADYAGEALTAAAPAGDDFDSLLDLLCGKGIRS
jgi:hypothetical protein